MITLPEFKGEINFVLIGNKNLDSLLAGITISSFGIAIAILSENGQAGSLTTYLLSHTQIDALISLLFFFYEISFIKTIFVMNKF